jgi:hypothetical protein
MRSANESTPPLTRAFGRALSCGLLCALPLVASAQTDEPVFGGWRANPLTVGSRAAGMGGAYVAVADDARAAVVNPAGLTQIPLTELAASSGRPWFSVASGRRRLRLGAYFNTSEQELLPSAVIPPINLQPAIWEAGLAAGFQPFRRVRLGATIAYRHLRVEEEGRSPANGSEPINPLVGGEDESFRLTAGTMVDLIPATVVGASPLKLGLSYQAGVSFKIPRGSDGDVEIRRPSVTSVGLAWRANNSWSLTGQADVLRYQEVLDALRQNVGEERGRDFRMGNAVEPRLGAEFATPLRCGCGTIKVRAGLHYESPGTLHYEGADSVLRDAFRVRSWRTTVTVGASLFAEHFGNALRIDVDSRDLVDGPALSVGAVWRF